MQYDNQDYSVMHRKIVFSSLRNWIINIPNAENGYQGTSVELLKISKMYKLKKKYIYFMDIVLIGLNWKLSEDKIIAKNYSVSHL